MVSDWPVIQSTIIYWIDKKVKIEQIIPFAGLHPNFSGISTISVQFSMWISAGKSQRPFVLCSIKELNLFPGEQFTCLKNLAEHRQEQNSSILNECLLAYWGFVCCWWIDERRQGKRHQALARYWKHFVILSYWACDSMLLMCGPRFYFVAAFSLFLWFDRVLCSVSVSFAHWFACYLFQSIWILFVLLRLIFCEKIHRSFFLLFSFFFF